MKFGKKTPATGPTKKKTVFSILALLLDPARPTNLSTKQNKNRSIRQAREQLNKPTNHPANIEGRRNTPQFDEEHRHGFSKKCSRRKPASRKPSVNSNLQRQHALANCATSPKSFQGKKKHPTERAKKNCHASVHTWEATGCVRTEERPRAVSRSRSWPHVRCLDSCREFAACSFRRTEGGENHLFNRSLLNRASPRRIPKQYPK